ncbi:hypothetical protein HANVADRAFT_51801 [Hanseniaspora valbyensis NRRL Y-1626]|uniref:Uncharacterized protein n=1 Tax=Hanseniaspora valbyensis NRRL Y-1626 TaxID=766949 RepID=A0A1B7THH3_9ASCO|nr:hypothetical protein HANVADRAFT_51801 [Hanseniaspora valbyensis NRRL Y-1626]
MSQNNKYDYDYDYSNTKKSDIKKFRYKNKLNQLFAERNNIDNISDISNDYELIRQKLEKKYLSGDKTTTTEEGNDGDDCNETEFSSCIESLEGALLKGKKALVLVKQLDNSKGKLQEEDLESELLIENYKIHKQELDDKLQEPNFLPKNNEEHQNLDDEFLNEIFNCDKDEHGENIIHILSSSDEETSDRANMNENESPVENYTVNKNDEDDALIESFLIQQYTNAESEDVKVDETDNDALEVENHEEVVEEIKDELIDKVDVQEKEFSVEREQPDVTTQQEESNINEIESLQNTESFQKYSLKYESDNVQTESAFEEQPGNEPKSLLDPSLLSINPFEQNNEKVADADFELNNILERVKKQKEQQMALQKQKEEDAKLLELKLIEDEERAKREEEERLEKERIMREEVEKQEKLDRLEKERLEKILQEKTKAELEYQKKFGTLTSEITSKQQNNDLALFKLQQHQKTLSELNEAIRQQSEKSQEMERERLDLEQKAKELEEKVEQERKLKENIVLENLQKMLKQEQMYTNKLREQISTKPVEIKINHEDGEDIIAIKQQLAEEIAEAQKLENELNSNNSLNEKSIYNDQDIEFNEQEISETNDPNSVDLDSDGVPLLMEKNQENNDNEYISTQSDDVYENSDQDIVTEFYQKQGIPEGQYLTTKLKSYLASKREVPDNSSLQKIQESRVTFNGLVIKAKDSMKRNFENLFTTVRKPLNNTESEAINETSNDEEIKTEDVNLDENDLEKIKSTYTKRQKLNNSSYRITKVYANEVSKEDLISHPALVDEAFNSNDSSNSDIKIISLVREKMITNPTDEVIVISSSDEEE